MQYPSWGCYFAGNEQHFLPPLPVRIHHSVYTVQTFLNPTSTVPESSNCFFFFFIISLGFHIPIFLVHLCLNLLLSTVIFLCPISTLDKSNLYRLSITSYITFGHKFSIFLLKMTGSPNGHVFPNYQPQILSPLHPTASSGFLNVHILTLTSDWVDTIFCLLFPALINSNAFVFSKPSTLDSSFVVLFGCLLHELAKSQKSINGKRQAEITKKTTNKIIFFLHW